MSGIAASSDVFRAVGDPSRRAILEMLRDRDRSFQELREPFPISQPAVSKHLRILLNADLVRVQRRGRQTVYALHSEPLRDVYAWAMNFRQFVDPGGHVWSFSPATKLTDRSGKSKKRKGGRNVYSRSKTK